MTSAWSLTRFFPSCCLIHLSQISPWSLPRSWSYETIKSFRDPKSRNSRSWVSVFLGAKQRLQNPQVVVIGCWAGTVGRASKKIGWFFRSDLHNCDADWIVRVWLVLVSGRVKIYIIYIYIYQFDGAPIEGKIRDHRNEPWNVANFHSGFQLQVTFQSQVSPCHFPPRLVSNVLPQATSSPGDPLSSLPKFTFKASKNPGDPTSAFQLPHNEEGQTMMAWSQQVTKSHPACRRKPVAIIWSQILNDCAIFFPQKVFVAQAVGVNDKKNLPSILWLLFIPLSFQIFTSKRMRVAKSNLPEAISSEITRDICSKLHGFYFPAWKYRKTPIPTSQSTCWCNPNRPCAPSCWRAPPTALPRLEETFPNPSFCVGFGPEKFVVLDL